MKTKQTDQKTFYVGGLEVYAFGLVPKSARPVVFVLHGRSGKAEDIFRYCRDLADAGMTALALDQRNHGRRLLDDRCNTGWNPDHAVDMYSTFLGTALDISFLIDWLPVKYKIPVKKIGVTGISLGGHASFMAMGLDKRIQVCAALIGSVDYRHLMELRAMENRSPKKDFPNYYPKSLQNLVARYDPINNLKTFSNRPLLMCNGAADTLVQAECNARFLKKLMPFYRNKNRLKQSIYPGVAHEVPDTMWHEARQWLLRWLL
jgi:dienelactone hydrolase